MTSKINFSPLVSVIMNCYNSDKYLVEAIESVLNQKYTNWEIVFWDNCSTDKSPEIVKSYNDKRINYYRGDELVTLGKARNFAIEKCKGEFISFLDCDDVWLQDKLKKQVPLFLDKKTDIVFSDTLFFNHKGKEWRLYKKKKYYVGKCFSKLISNYFLSLETVIVRKDSVLKQPYWYNEDYSVIEEADLFRRIAYNGGLDMVNEVLAKWRVHEESYTWRNINQLSLETEQMIKEYSEIYDNFEIEYKREINALRTRVLITEGKFYLETGKNKLARKLILGYKHKKSILYFIMFFLTFIPSKLLKFLFNLK